MDSHGQLLIRLDAAEPCDENIIGGKAAKLAQLARAGFSVPKGFCLTTWAYEAFVEDAKITAAIRMELGRKSMDDMRWEEIWDAALRIRAMFFAHPLSERLAAVVAKGLRGLDSSLPLAVRSSAIGEDSAGRSFAGLHESVTGVLGKQAVEDAVRLVWASLWSDAALLYRKELELDPARSRMAVLVQQMVDADRSGVAFARDPRDTRKQHVIIESVPGPCSLLVDGLVDPDRWEIDRRTRRVTAWIQGQRDDSHDNVPLLQARDLEEILETLMSVEQLFHWAPDMEWSGRCDSFHVLQARPITTLAPDDDAERRWYLTLRPGDARLRELRKRVTEQLIPALETEAQHLAAEQLDPLDDLQLADAIAKRCHAVEKWKKIYWDEFIPFAHGVRRLATYYNDAVQPEDPYEFVGLLRDQPLLATQRNRSISELAKQIASRDPLRDALEHLLAKHAGSLDWPTFRDELTQMGVDADRFVEGFDEMKECYLDVAYDQARMHDQTESLLRNIVELSQRSKQRSDDIGLPSGAVSVLESRLLDAVGPERHEEAMEIVQTGRVSWKLRDDDNLLVARLDSQLLRALDTAAQRLQDRGRLSGEARPNHSHIQLLVRALREPATGPIVIETIAEEPETASGRLHRTKRLGN